MTRTSIQEYLAAIRERYEGAGKEEKGRVLDEAVRITGYHRKALIRALRKKSGRQSQGRRGRRRRYQGPVIGALKELWEATDRICAKRLHPFIPELIPVLRRYGNRSITAEVEAQLSRMSAATMDRLLRPFRQAGGRRPLSTTKPGSLLKSMIPIRTFGDWEESRPGFLEVDLVAHCGESTEGFYLTTLNTVDIATGWVECQAVWGKGQNRVGAGIRHVAQRLPFPLLGLDSDNGGEFINQHLYRYCARHKITFTRSRPYKKNDSAHIEQKNWTVIRRVVGYDRFSSKAAYETMNRLYGVLHLYLNFFQPSMKLLSKTREGAKVRKVYDAAKTPYQRLLDSSGILTDEQRTALAATYRGLNPTQLLGYLQGHQERLWKQAERPARTPAPRGVQ